MVWIVFVYYWFQEYCFDELVVLFGFGEYLFECVFVIGCDCDY